MNNKINQTIDRIRLKINELEKRDRLMDCLNQYIITEFPEAFKTHFACDMLCNILTESEKFKDIGEACEWLSEMIPEVTLKEIRDLIMR